MLGTLRSRATYPYVVSTLALFLALGTGGAYAVDEFTGANIQDGTLTTDDYKNNNIRSADIRDAVSPGGGITGDDIAVGAVHGGQIADASVAGDDLAAETVGQREIRSDGVAASEIEDDSIDSGEIVDNSLLAGDLATNSVGAPEIAPNSIGGSKVNDGALTMADLSGSDIAGTISVNGGAVPNGRCIDLTLTTPGTHVNDAVIVATRAPVDAGMLFYGVRVAVAGQSIVKACNFTGGASPDIDHLPIQLFSVR